jgi:hypothetical protein
MKPTKARLPSISPFAQKVHAGRRPMLLATSEVVDGYAQLEFAERIFTKGAIKKHRNEVSVWYQGLGLFLDGIRGFWDQAQDYLERDAYRICHEMIALEVGNAKVALDSILAGYYSIGFAAIRHLLESVAQCLYLLEFPHTANQWEEDKRGPQMRTLRKYYSTIDSPETNLFKDIDRAWHLMSSGSHPSGRGLLQVRMEPSDPGNIVGAYYRKDLAYIGLREGLLAMTYLLVPMEKIRPGDEPWIARKNAWGKRVGDVLETMDKRPDLKNIWADEAKESARIDQENAIQEQS